MKLKVKDLVYLQQKRNRNVKDNLCSSEKGVT